MIVATNTQSVFQPVFIVDNENNSVFRKVSSSLATCSTMRWVFGFEVVFLGNVSPGTRSGYIVPKTLCVSIKCCARKKEKKNTSTEPKKWNWSRPEDFEFGWFAKCSDGFHSSAFSVSFSTIFIIFFCKAIQLLIHLQNKCHFLVDEQNFAVLFCLCLLSGFFFFPWMLGQALYFHYPHDVFICIIANCGYY